MRVAGYCLKKEAQYLYLVKDSRESQESRTSLALSQDLNNISLIPFNATGTSTLKLQIQNIFICSIIGVHNFIQ